MRRIFVSQNTNDMNTYTAIICTPGQLTTRVEKCNANNLKEAKSIFEKMGNVIMWAAEKGTKLHS